MPRSAIYLASMLRELTLLLALQVPPELPAELVLVDGKVATMEGL